MAAPSHTAAPAPTGYKVPDGFKTMLVCSLKPNIALWQKTVKPPGVDGGEKIDTTTMHNTTWRTFHPRQLITLTEASFQAAYDPDVWTGDMLAVINRNVPWTCYFADGSYMDFYAAMTKWEPGENKEGEMPMAATTISPTNYDDLNQTEAAPVFTPAVGT